MSGADAVRAALYLGKPPSLCPLYELRILVGFGRLASVLPSRAAGRRERPETSGHHSFMNSSPLRSAAIIVLSAAFFFITLSDLGAASLGEPSGRTAQMPQSKPAQVKTPGISKRRSIRQPQPPEGILLKDL